MSSYFGLPGTLWTNALAPPSSITSGKVAPPSIDLRKPTAAPSSSNPYLPTTNPRVFVIGAATRAPSATTPTHDTSRFIIVHLHRQIGRVDVASEAGVKAHPARGKSGPNGSVRR